MGKKIAPANKNPHIACPKQVKMCVSHAAKHSSPMMVGKGLSSMALSQGKLVRVFVCLNLDAFAKGADQVVL